MAADNMKLLGALGLARRAGKLLSGNDRVCEAAQKSATVVVYITSDTASGTAKKVRAACEGHCPVHAIPLTQNDIASLTNKPAGVLAVTDMNLATLCQNALGALLESGEEEPD